MQYIISREESQEIEAILLDLLVRAEAEAIFLCDKGGNIVAQNTTEQYAHEENIAALAAGSFYATRELARLIGEPVFRYIFHRGDKTSIYMQNTIKDMLLLVVFGRQSNPGLVK
ncbi:MAG: roadblock/LC7 domain-containing protein, partial [Victivallales bacterium]|nr:roadblock/LC7 domain-containing protein [Victivallales bacterium]